MLANTPLLHGSAANRCAVAHGAGEEADNGELVIRGFEQLVQWVKGAVVTCLSAAASTPNRLARTKARAVEFAKSLTPSNRHTPCAVRGGKRHGKRHEYV